MAEEMNTNPNQIGLEDVNEASQEEIYVSPLLDHVMERFHKAEDARRVDEERWMRAYRNYRGIYGSDVQFTETEKSRVFIKVTKTKTLAAYGQIVDVLFANNSFPISVEPTILPEGVADTVHFDPADKTQAAQGVEASLYGYKGDGNPLPPGATARTLMDRLGPLKDKLKDMVGLKEGPGVTPSALTFSPAQIAAKKMEKKIKDQLDESNASKQLRSAAFEMA